MLRRRGVAVGLVFHGTDIRHPARHAASTRWSPFHEEHHGLTRTLMNRVARLERELAREALPEFVATPDLLADRPNATWLPVVIEPDMWAAAARPILPAGRTPVVVHAPSESVFKGSDLIDPVLTRLDEEGLIEYRRVSGVPAGDMPEVYGDADIVVDQLRMRIYGVAACEAMAAGRIVVSEVSPMVREHVRAASGLDLPVVDATAETLDAVLRGIVADPGSFIELASSGPAFVRELHDGRRSAAALSAFLGGN